MSLVTEILTADQLHELWGCGFTIVRRGADPFEIDPKLIPAGRAYQWNPIKSDGPDVVASEGWTPVPYSRHEGVFAPWGTPGDIQIRGMQLVEKAKDEVKGDLARTQAKALQNVEDWHTKAAALGFTGSVQVGADSVRVGTQTVEGKLDSLSEIDRDEVAWGLLRSRERLRDAVARFQTKTIETTVGIPREMTPYIASIFKERDRLEAEVVRKDRTLVPGPIADKFYATIEVQDGAQWWPTLRAILLPIAIENVRAALPDRPITAALKAEIAKLKKDDPDE